MGAESESNVSYECVSGLVRDLYGIWKTFDDPRLLARIRTRRPAAAGGEGGAAGRSPFRCHVGNECHGKWTYYFTVIFKLNLNLLSTIFQRQGCGAQCDRHGCGSEGGNPVEGR